VRPYDGVSAISWLGYFPVFAPDYEREADNARSLSLILARPSILPLTNLIFAPSIRLSDNCICGLHMWFSRAYLRDTKGRFATYGVSQPAPHERRRIVRREGPFVENFHPRAVVG
jgi:hypothetical protein